MKVNKVKQASYNPRKMSDNAKRALKISMDEFQDISGIVWNVRTGNLVSGNHRWQILCEKYGKDNLELVRLDGKLDDHLAVNSKGEFTGYIIREVDWDEETEKAANITANNEKLTGQYTNAVGDILKSISDSSSRLPKSIFDGLRLNELKLDFGVDDIKFDSNIGKPEIDINFDAPKENKQEKTTTSAKAIELDLEDLDDMDIDIDLGDIIESGSTSNKKVNNELTVIQVQCKMSRREDIVNIIKNALINENNIIVE